MSDKSEVQKWIAELSNDDLMWRRYAASALSEMGKSAKEALPSLIKALDDEHWVVRGYSARSLGRMGVADESIISLLTKASHDDDWWVRHEANRALSELGQPKEEIGMYPEDYKVKSSDPMFLGFLPRKVLKPKPEDSWLPPHIKQICSVSGDNSKRPPNMFGSDREWNYNRACLYDDVESASKDIPSDEENEWEMFAYKAYSISLDKNGIHEIDLLKHLPGCSQSINPNPDLSGFHSIGYDIINGVNYLSYGCSPLACNGLARDFYTNEFCLIDDLQYAIRAGVKFEEIGAEPPPYYVFEVYRQYGKNNFRQNHRP